MMKTKKGKKAVIVNDMVIVKTDKGPRKGAIMYISGDSDEKAVYTIAIPYDDENWKDDLVDIHASETEEYILDKL